MAKEVVSSWDSARSLVTELIAPDGDEDRKLHRFIEENKVADISWTMEFSLEDGAGKTVAFPLRLISNTDVQTKET